jgi:hypothetical protein
LPNDACRMTPVHGRFRAAFPARRFYAGLMDERGAHYS